MKIIAEETKVKIERIYFDEYDVECLFHALDWGVDLKYVDGEYCSTNILDGDGELIAIRKYIFVTKI